MAEVEWCKECGRMIGVGCACDLTFKDKMKSVAWSMEGLPNAAPVEDASQAYQDKFPNSKLSKHKPKPLR